MADAILNTDAFNKGIDRLIGALDKLDKQLNQSVKQVSAIDKIFGDSDGFKKFLKSIEGIDKVNAKSFKAIALGMDALARAASKFSAIKSIDDVVEKFRGILPVFSALGKVSDIVSQDDIKVVNSVANLLVAFSGKISKNVKAENIEKIKQAISGIVISVRGIALITSILPGTEDMARVSKSIEQISIAMQRFANTFKKTDLSIITKVSKAFAGLAVVFRLIGTITKVLPGEKETNELSKVFDRLGRGLRSLNQFSKDATFGKALQIGKTLAALALALRVASKFSGNATRIKAFGDAINGVSQLFKIVLETDTEQLKTKIAAFRESIKTLAKSVNELGKSFGRGGKSLAALSQIKDIQKLSAGLAQPSTARPGIATVFRNRLIENAADWLVRSLFNLRRNFTELKRNIATIARGIGNDIRKIGDVATRIGLTINRNLGVGRLLRSQGINAALEFDQLSSRIQAFGNLTDQQVKKAQDFANQIGIDYPLSANQALEATLSLIKAGQDLSNVEFVLPNAADLAALSESGDVNAAAQSLIAFEGAFSKFSEGIEASFENINVAADIVSAAAATSTASVDNLSAGLARVGPAARDAEVSLEETAAALALLDQAQIKGVEGGTALRGVLNSLIRPQTKQELDRLNVSLLNVDGSQRSLNQIVSDLSRRYKELGFTTAEVRQSLSKIAEVESRTALSVLVANNGLTQQLNSMRRIPSAADRAAQSIDNIRGDIEQLGGSFETFITKAALPLLNRFLRPVIQAGRAVVDFLIQLPDPVLETASTMVLLVTSVAAVTAGFSVMVGVGLKLAGTLISIVSGTALLLLRLPILIVTLGAVASSIVVLLPLIIAIGSTFTAVAFAITSVFRDIEDNVRGAADQFRKFKKTFSDVLSEIGQAFSNLTTIVTYFFGFFDRSYQGSRVADFFRNLDQSLRITLQNVRDLNKIFETFILFLGGTGTTEAFDRYKSALEAITQTPIAQRLFGEDVTAAHLDRFFRATHDVLARIFQAAANISDGLLGQLFGIGNAENLALGIQQAFELAIQATQGLTGIDFSEALFAVREGKIRDGASKYISAIVRQLREVVRENQERISDMLGNLLNFTFNTPALLESITRFLGFNLIADALGVVADAITVFFDGVADLIVRSFVGGSREAGEQASRNLFGRIVDTAKEVFESIKTAAASFTAAVDGIGSDLFNQFIQYLPVAIDLVTQFASRVFNLAQEALPAVIDITKSVISNIAVFIQSVSQNIIPVVNAWVTGIIESSQTTIAFLGSFVYWFKNVFATSFIDFIDGTLKPFAIEFIGAISTLLQALIPIALKIQSFLLTRVFSFIQTGITGLVLPALDLFINGFRLVVAFVTPIIYNLAKAFEFIWPVIAIVIDAILISIEGIINVFGQLANIVGNVFSTLATLFTRYFKLYKDIFETVFEPVLDAFSNGFLRIWNKISPALRNLQNGLFSTFKWIVDNVFNVLKVAIDAVFDALGSIWERVKGPVGQFTQGIADGITGLFNIFETFIDFIIGVANEIDRVVDGVKEFFRISDSRQESKPEDTFLSETKRRVEQGDVSAFGLLNRLFLESENPKDVEKELRKNADGIFEVIRDIVKDRDALESLLPDQFGGILRALISTGDIEELPSLIGDNLESGIEQLFKSIASDPTLLENKELQQLIPEIINRAIASGDVGSIRSATVFLDSLGLSAKITTDEMRGYADVIEDVLGIGIEDHDKAIQDLIKTWGLTESEANQLVFTLGQIGSELEGGSNRASLFGGSLDDLGQAIEEAEKRRLNAGLFEEAAGTIGNAFNDALDDALEKGADSDKVEKLGEDVLKIIDTILKDGVTDSVARDVSRVIDEIEKLEVLSPDQLTNLERALGSIEQIQGKIEENNEIVGNPEPLFDLVNFDAATFIIENQIETIKDLNKFLKDGTLNAKEYALAVQELKGRQSGVKPLPEVDQDLIIPLDQLEEVDEETEEEKKRTEEFKKLSKDRQDDRKREEDSIEKLEKAEKKRQDDLTKQLQSIDSIQTEFDAEQLEKQADFNRTTQRNEEDHRRKIDEIIQSADEQLEDAAISRNSSAAQEAIKNARKQSEEEQRNFELSEQRRLEDFNLQQAQAQAEKDERIREAQERLAEMRVQHDEERAEEAKNHQELLAEITEREAERLAKEQELTQELIDEQRAASEERIAIEQREADARKKIVDETTKAANDLILATSDQIKGMFGFIGLSANEAIKQIGSNDPFKQAASIGKSLPPAQVSTPKGIPVKSIKITPISIPALNTGGDVLKSGLAMLHAGEKVLSQQMVENPYARPQIGSGNGSVSLQLNLGGINVNGSNMDAHGLANEIVSQAEQRIVPKLTQQIRRLKENQRNI